MEDAVHASRWEKWKAPKAATAPQQRQGGASSSSSSAAAAQGEQRAPVFQPMVPPPLPVPRVEPLPGRHSSSSPLAYADDEDDSDVVVLQSGGRGAGR